jgi:hypothetical protein
MCLGTEKHLFNLIIISGMEPRTPKSRMPESQTEIIALGYVCFILA